MHLREQLLLTFTVVAREAIWTVTLVLIEQIKTCGAVEARRGRTFIDVFFFESIF